MVDAPSTDKARDTQGAAALPVFFDESGFTGYDLLNSDQPNFCVASSLIGDAEALDLLRDAFPQFGGAEFAFTSIWKKPRNRRGLLAFAEHVRRHQDRLIVYSVDKKFCVLQKLIDFLIEPPLHRAGYDFYADGFAMKYSNLWFYRLEECGEPELYDATVALYQRFARNPSHDELANLQTTLEIMATSVPEPLREGYEAAAAGARSFSSLHDMSTFDDTSELQLTTVLQCVAYWRNRLEPDFAVFHDASSNFFRQRELWDRVTHSGVPEQLHDGANGANRYPLRVVSTMPLDSRQSPAIQFCDVLAGLTNRQHRINGAEDRAFLDEVIDAGLGELIVDGIRPHPVFPDGPPARLSGPDAVDQLMEIMFPDRPKHRSQGE